MSGSRGHRPPVPGRACPATTAVLSALCLILLVLSAALAQSFPALTGRVTDAAGLLSPGERQALEAKLKAH
jgi:uncharacterized protein